MGRHVPRGRDALAMHLWWVQFPSGPLIKVKTTRIDMWEKLVRLKASIRREHVGMAMIVAPFAVALLAFLIAIIATAGWMGLLVITGILALVAWLSVGIYLLE